MDIEVSGLLTEVTSSFLPYGPWGLNPSPQVWWQVPLPTEPSQPSQKLIFQSRTYGLFTLAFVAMQGLYIQKNK